METLNEAERKLANENQSILDGYIGYVLQYRAHGKTYVHAQNRGSYVLDTNIGLIRAWSRPMAKNGRVSDTKYMAYLHYAETGKPVLSRDLKAQKIRVNGYEWR